MEKKITDYLHYYINVARFRLRYVDYTSEQWSVWTILTPLRYKQCVEDASVENIQLELRPLSSITEEEAIEVNVSWSSTAKVTWEKPMWSFKEVHYLLSRGFDLFGLIDAELAIPK